MKEKFEETLVFHSEPNRKDFGLADGWPEAARQRGTWSAEEHRTNGNRQANIAIVVKKISGLRHKCTGPIKVRDGPAPGRIELHTHSDGRLQWSAGALEGGAVPTAGQPLVQKLRLAASAPESTSVLSGLFFLVPSSVGLADDVLSTNSERVKAARAALVTLL